MIDCGIVEDPVDIVWSPQAGSQVAFMSCPHFQALLEGTRGGGKTDVLLMDFGQHVGTGFGQAWRGILFRRTYPQLADVIAKTQKWFRQIFPEATFNKSETTWTFATGEQLLLRHFDKSDDYWNYHGHEYPWIGWEELTNWPNLDGYESMLTCCRSSQAGMPRKVRATANPFGVGHNAVKKQFIDPAPPFVPVYDEQGRATVRIHSSIYENKILLTNDPEYLSELKKIKSKNKRKAWLKGSWDITAGGMFDDLWDTDHHTVKPFKIPAHWYVDRSFDWGSSKPFSVLWWAEANGETVKTEDGRTIMVPKGTIFCINEWYGGADNKGLHMTATAIAKGIKEREAAMIVSGIIKSLPNKGAADSAIFTVDDEKSIADKMAEAGIKWVKSTKGPGSRVNGWEAIRERLEAATMKPVEDPAIYFFDTCRNIISHLPVLPRDEKKMDDVDTNAEDHDGDAARYRLMTKRTSVGTAEAPW